MAEMSGLLSSRTLEKVLVREASDNPVTKIINAISLIKMEKEGGVEGGEVAKRNVIWLNELEALKPIESPNKEEEMDEGTNRRSVESMQEELMGLETKAEDVKQEKKEKLRKEFGVEISVAGGSFSYLYVELGDFVAFIAADLEGDSDEELVPDTKFEEDFPNQKGEEDSVGQGHLKKSEVPKSGGSILQLIDDLVKVEETISASVGNSGGILCVWDLNMFKKTNSTVLDYFVMVRGDWMPNGKKLFIISVYVPQELYEKKMLRDYFSLVMSKWEGELVIMGDFNEVRNKSERFGTLFNRHGADLFNRFISNAGLEEVDGFDKFIEDSWKDAPIIESNTLVRMMKKLKYLKEKIRMSNKLNKEKSYKSKGSLLAELADYDAIIDKGEGENNVVNRTTEVVNLLQEVEKNNSLEAAQKAKIKWATEGDENSKYYHGVINKKRNRLSIRGILVDGIWIDYPSLVKSEFLSHFKNQFEQPNSNRLHMNMHFLNTLSYVQVANLEYQVSKEEIKKAMWDCWIDKSPGPDGFTFGFYHRYWKLVKNDVVDAVMCFFHQSLFPKGGNSSFINLIPKTPNANMAKDYSLVNEIQSAFVADKQILDGPFILNELVQWYDIMRKFSFGEKWCMWIQSCLRSSRGPVIMNGSPMEEFLFYKGLKQVDVGLFKGIKLAHSLNLSHMFYADDAIFMGQWSESNIDTIVKVLDCFNRASGLRINMTKRSKVGGCMSRIQSWNDTIESMACRLYKWKLKTLSIGDKGGHGVSSLFALNRALMFKWVWHFITQGSSLWDRVIKALHGYDGKIGQKVKSCYPSLWLDIIHEVEMFKSCGIDLVILIHLKLSNGANTPFWEVAWRGGSPFKSIFPRLYALETQKKIDVTSKLSHSGLDVSFRHPPRGGVEIQQFEHMKEKVKGIDRWFWALEGSGEFTIMSVRKLIDDFMLPEVSSKTRRIKAVPIMTQSDKNLLSNGKIEEINHDHK
nr:RNA-directed DNA polymerase, eukaryota, reverse transcriptase zinc-binding domain protein [Tanacetum cinerariifolium]